MTPSLGRLSIYLQRHNKYACSDEPLQAFFISFLLLPKIYRFVTPMLGNTLTYSANPLKNELPIC